MYVAQPPPAVSEVMTEFDKIDVTAKLAAYMRQFSDIPFAREVADYVGAKAACEEILRSTSLKPQELTWYAPIFEARYKSIAEVLRKSGIRQVLELASGVSLRGLAMTQDPSMTYIETDMPAITDMKRAVVAGIQREHGFTRGANYRIVAANAIEREDLVRAVDGFDGTRPVAIVNEGLLQYLSPAELRMVASNVQGLLRRFGGIWITPDFSLRRDEGAVSERQRIMRDAVVGATGRSMYESGFADEAALLEFFDEMGFQADVRFQVDEAAHVVSVRRLNLPPDTLVRLRPRLRLWVLHSNTVS